MSNLDNIIGNNFTDIDSAFNNAAQSTYDMSQADVPVESGTLKDSGRVTNPSRLVYEVTYGDGNGYSKYGLEDGYAWFVELGHLTRSGSSVPPQPYLLANFNQNALGLMNLLTGLLS
jgi:hypothetical protein